MITKHSWKRPHGEFCTCRECYAWDRMDSRRRVEEFTQYTNAFTALERALSGARA